MYLSQHSSDCLFQRRREETKETENVPPSLISTFLRQVQVLLIVYKRCRYTKNYKKYGKITQITGGIILELFEKIIYKIIVDFIWSQSATAASLWSVSGQNTA